MYSPHAFTLVQQNQPSTSLPVVITYQVGDVTGDRIPDVVYLTGTRSAGGSPFVENITLVIQDGRTGRSTRVPLKSNAGYAPTLFLGDFTGDKINDILIRIDSGGSGAITYDYIYSFVNSQARLLFDYEQFNQAHPYEVNYLDNYRVQMISQNPPKTYILDITYKGQEYLSEIYNPDGRLKAPIQGWVNPISGFYPIDYQRDGTFEILAMQRIAGRYNADALGYVMNSLSWNGVEFVPYQQWVAIS
ncbi:VCBS repeat-containing protein [Brevibacillus dissolubilis]|uniref:VCBS repeat-containing protein n=1 Tax=Brevibacillus dissolubilis TaxID=1844116 RepID=UPI0011172608|nr:VCBS repeat-containing protein [Brevibacillus dissolubilis]